MLTLSKSLSFGTLLHYFYDYLTSVHRGDRQGQSSDPTVHTNPQSTRVYTRPHATTKQDLPQH